MAEEIAKAKTERELQPEHANPFHQMRSEIDRLFDSFLTNGLTGLPRLAPVFGDGQVMPKVEVRESAKELVIDAELPGLKEEDVDVTLRDGVLRITGEKRAESEKDDDDYHIRERSYGQYSRAFRLPDTVDAEKIEASLRNGVLHITVPKRPDAVRAEKKIAIS